MVNRCVKTPFKGKACTKDAKVYRRTNKKQNVQKCATQVTLVKPLKRKLKNVR